MQYESLFEPIWLLPVLHRLCILKYRQGQLKLLQRLSCSIVRALSPATALRKIASGSSTVDATALDTSLVLDLLSLSHSLQLFSPESAGICNNQSV